MKYSQLSNLNVIIVLMIYQNKMKILMKPNDESLDRKKNQSIRYLKRDTKREEMRIRIVINKNGINDLTCLKNYRGVWLLVGRVVETVQKCELYA